MKLDFDLQELIEGWLLIIAICAIIAFVVVIVGDLIYGWMHGDIWMMFHPSNPLDNMY